MGQAIKSRSSVSKAICTCNSYWRILKLKRSSRSSWQAWESHLFRKWPASADEFHSCIVPSKIRNRLAA